MIRVVGIVGRKGHNFVPSPPDTFFACVQSGSAVALEPTRRRVAKRFAVCEFYLRGVSSVAGVMRKTGVNILSYLTKFSNLLFRNALGDAVQPACVDTKGS